MDEDNQLIEDSISKLQEKTLSDLTLDEALVYRIPSTYLKPRLDSLSGTMAYSGSQVTQQYEVMQGVFEQVAAEPSYSQRVGNDLGLDIDLSRVESSLKDRGVNTEILEADRESNQERKNKIPLTQNEKAAAQKVIKKIEEKPDVKERVCAALAEGNTAAAELVKAVVVGLGGALIAGTAVSAALAPPALVVATVLLLLRMGSGYFCVDEKSS